MTTHDQVADICQRYGLDADQGAHRRYGCRLADLTAEQAAALLRHLHNRQATRPAPGEALVVIDCGHPVVDPEHPDFDPFSREEPWPPLIHEEARRVVACWPTAREVATRRRDDDGKSER